MHKEEEKPKESLPEDSSKESLPARIFRIFFLFFSVFFVLICINEVSTRDSLLLSLEHKKSEILEDLFDNGFNSRDPRDEIVTDYVDVENPRDLSTFRDLGDKLKITDLMITELRLLITQGVATDISLSREQIIKHYTMKPELALSKLIRLKREFDLIKELEEKILQREDEERKLKEEKAKIESRISYRVKEIETFQTFYEYLYRKNKDVKNESMVERIKRQIYTDESDEAKLIIEIEERESELDERIAEYNRRSSGISFKLKQVSDAIKRMQNDLEDEETKSKQTNGEVSFKNQIINTISVLDPTTLPTDYLLAFTFIFSGLLGSIILTIRSNDHFFESKIILIGVSTGLILFLGVKGGPDVFLSSMDESIGVTNIYSSALFGIIGGLFSEKIYSILNVLTTRVKDDIENNLKNPKDDEPSP